MKISFLRCIFALLLLMPLGTQAQTEYGETLVSRLYAGGNFGLGFGTLTSIDVSPMIGYNINRHFSGGVGATYMYYSYRNYTGQSERASFYGGRIFGRIVPLPDMLPNIFLHGEIESINNERWVENEFGAFEFKRAWTPAVPVGAGFKQMAGENSFFSITILWNLLDDGTQASSIYGGPLLYRVGFIFGFN